MTRLHWYCSCVAGLVLALFSHVAFADNLVLSNTLGSQFDIEHSTVGPNGTFAGGSFGPGRTLGTTAYYATSSQISLVQFPAQVIPFRAGSISFWAKLINYPSSIPIGQSPSFVTAEDGSGAFYNVMLNGNDGVGGAGLSGFAGNTFEAATGFFTTPFTYEDVLGTGAQGDWHHYELIWDENGIAGLSGRRVAVAIDGIVTNDWHRDDLGSPSEFRPLTGGTLDLLFNQGGLPQDAVTAIQDLQIRGVVPEPASLVQLAGFSSIIGFLVLAGRHKHRKRLGS